MEDLDSFENSPIINNQNDNDHDHNNENDDSPYIEQHFDNEDDHLHDINHSILNNNNINDIETIDNNGSHNNKGHGHSHKKEHGEHGHSHGSGEKKKKKDKHGGHGHSHNSGEEHHSHENDESGSGGHHSDDEESKPLNKLKNMDSKKKARYALIVALTLTTIFMVGEIVGGYFANSLAIMTDAAHLLTDIGAMFLSLFAMWISSHPPTSTLSFGFHRAEILGALVSVLMIWALTGVLVYEAIQRIINPPDVVDGKIMFIIATCGLAINIIDAIILHWGSGGHGHSHGLSGSKSHGHSHGDSDNKKKKKKSGHGHAHGEGEQHIDIEEVGKKKRIRNINVHSAYIHVLGDCFQSVGVMIASVIIWIRPHWKIADPITTLIFSIIVLGTTIKLLRESLGVLMEAVPTEIDVSEVKGDLSEIEGVTEVHDLHIWSITLGRPALSVHLTILPEIDSEQVLSTANKILLEEYEINHTTIQIEKPLIKGDKCRDHSCPPPISRNKK